MYTLALVFHPQGENQKRAGAASSKPKVAPAGKNMPKTVSHIWDEIARFSNLALAYQRTCRGQRFGAGAVAFNANLEENLFALESQLQQCTWGPSPFREFVIHEPKLRLVQAPAFCDRVVHQAVMHHTAPVFERRFIHDSYANRIGFGTHQASHRLRAFMRAASSKWVHPYAIKADIKSYFPSISHDLLMLRVRRLFTDPGVLWFFERVITGCGLVGKGLPIGSLTSQWLANLYLDALDHHAKENLGIRYYLRYMDDFIVVGQNKAWCRDTLHRLEDFTQSLQLALNPKTSIMPLSSGVDFVGYRHWTDHVLPRKRTVARARRSFRSMQRRYAAGQIDLDFIRARVASFTGYMRHCDGHRSTMAILGDFVLGKPAREGKDKL